MNTISFNKAIQMVHPDKNPHILDAGTKVREIMMYKKEPSMMYKLLKRWGLINDNSTTSPEPRKRKNHFLKNLFTNYDYSNEDVFIYHRRYYGRFYVKRTTIKRVYFSDKTVRELGMKYCSINSVTKAFRQGSWE